MFLRHLLPFLALLALSCQPQPTPPNIVLILADDFGVGDIQAHYPDNKIPTPYLDRLVSQGMSFTDAHSGSAVCSPTRYGLMTGRYAWRTALQEWVLAAYEGPLISKDRLTLPGFLQQQGYHTGLVGKWHLGQVWPGEVADLRPQRAHVLDTIDWDFSQPLKEGPNSRGFDYYFGTDVPNFPPFGFIQNDHLLAQPTAQYVYDSTQGVVMPRRFEGSPMVPGWEFDQILPTLTDKAVSYIHERAQQEEPFFLFFSMTSPHEPVSPSEAFAGKSGIAPIADFVMETDWSAGQVIEALEKAGVAENTIVIFTADNGHSHYTGWEELVAAGHRPSGPYRGHKGDIWEGGHRVPLVVRWPGQVAPGSQREQLVCLTDLFATCADVVTGDSLPGDAAEDSYSFLPSLRGEGRSPRQQLVSHSVHGEFAYRDGPWKLVYALPEEKRGPSRGQAARRELYHLGDDRAETTDRAAGQPDEVARLHKALTDLVDRGTSRPGPAQRNEARVWYDTIQPERWGVPLP